MFHDFIVLKITDLDITKKKLQRQLLMQDTQRSAWRTWFFPLSLAATGQASTSPVPQPQPCWLRPLLASSLLWFAATTGTPGVCRVCLLLIVLLIKLITQSSTRTTKKKKQNHKSLMAEEAKRWHRMAGVQDMRGWRSWLALQAPWATSLKALQSKGNEKWHTLSLALGKKELSAPASCIHILQASLQSIPTGHAHTCVCNPCVHRQPGRKSQ